MMMGSVGSDELLVARQADDGGAGGAFVGTGRRRPSRRRAGAASTRPRGAAGRRAPAVARVGVDGVRRGPLATHRVPRERDAKTPRRGSTSRRREDEQRAKGHRKRTGQRGDDVDEAQRPQRGQAPAREGCVRVATELLRRTRPRDSAGNENGTAPRSAESAGRKHARTAMITTPSAIFSGLAPFDAAPFVVPFLGSVQLETPVRSLT